MEVITWLNSNSGAITAIATVVLVGITAFYAWVTRQMRLDAQKPRIAIYLDSYTTDRTHVVFNVENAGADPAYTIEFSGDLSIKLDDTRSLEEGVPFLRAGIGYLVPGQKRKYHIGTESQLDIDELKQKPPIIDVTYKDSVNQKYKEPFCLNFREHFCG